MYSDSHLRTAARDGFYCYQESRNRMTPRKRGYGDAGTAWSWWTGHESARTGQSLTACYRTLKEKHRHG